MYCQNPACGTEVASRYKFCPSCGGNEFGQQPVRKRTPASIRPSAITSKTALVQPRTAKPLLAIVLGVTLLLMGAAFVMYLATGSLEVDADAKFDGSWDKIKVVTRVTNKTWFGQTEKPAEQTITIKTASGTLLGTSNEGTIQIDESTLASGETIDISVCASAELFLRKLVGCQNTRLTGSEKTVLFENPQIIYPLDMEHLDRISYSFSLTQNRKAYGSDGWERIGSVDKPIHLLLWAGENRATAAIIDVRASTQKQTVSATDVQGWSDQAQVFETLREQGGDLPVHLAFEYEGKVLKSYQSTLRFKSKEERLFEEFPVLGAALQIKKSPNDFLVHIVEFNDKEVYADIQSFSVDENLGRIEMYFDYRGGSPAIINPASHGVPNASGSYKARLPFLGPTEVPITLTFNRDGTARGRWANMGFSGAFEIVKK